MQLNTYLTDTYLGQAQTRVLAVGKRDGAPWAAIEHNLFHPQGGGQPADRGWLDEYKITPVRDQESGLIVVVAADTTMALPHMTDGQPVQARIDLDARKLHAALHTAGHLIEAAGRERGWQLAANNHFPGQARIEFTAPTGDDRLADPEARAVASEALGKTVAAAIADDLPVTVHLDDLHSAPCGGTHVHSLGDLAEIALVPVKVKKGRIRVSYSAAHRER
jgi:alanyl-tRNA synthetase